jgi:hypothetical protein
MSHLIFIEPLEISGFSPKMAGTGFNFLITGKNFEDATTVYFLNQFEERFTTPFSLDPAKNITGRIPYLNPPEGFYKIGVENEISTVEKCCIQITGLSFPPITGLTDSTTYYLKWHSETGMVWQQ